MNILFCGDNPVGFTGNYYLKVLRRQGHRVVTAGLGRDIDPGRTVPLPVVLERCRALGFSPDLIVEHESGFCLTDVRGHTAAPTVWLSADTNIHHRWHAERSAWFDYVFISQKDFVDEFRSRGNPRTWWLPFACDPEVHRPHDLPEAYDIGFVGNVHNLPLYEERVRLLERLARRYNVRVAAGITPEEMAVLYSRCRIVFNHSPLNNFNMRVFEALSCGRLLVTNRVGNGLLDLFRDREHLVVYDDESTLFSLVDHYLARPDARRAIALAGQREVHARHTYVHRVDFLLRTVFGSRA